jgi:hypothetical protein
MREGFRCKDHSIRSALKKISTSVPIRTGFVAAQRKAGPVRLDRVDAASVARPANVFQREKVTAGFAPAPKRRAESVMKAPCLTVTAPIPFLDVSPFDLFVDPAEWLFGFRSP